jgi:dTMP kinase
MIAAAANAGPERGRFITFEGGEGSGKSTQIKILAERLNAAKLRTIVTREPGGSPGAEIIRHLVLSGMGKLLGADAETLLFAAARDDHVHTVVKPALEQGIWVLCDRFADSTRAYQGRLGNVLPGDRQLRDAYRDIAASDPQRCVVIDANADVATVAASVWTALRDRVLTADPVKEVTRT